MVLNINNPEHHKIAMPYYYAHYKTNEIVHFLQQRSITTNVDDLRALFIRFQKHGIPRYNRERILEIAEQELQVIRHRIANPQYS